MFLQYLVVSADLLPKTVCMKPAKLSPRSPCMAVLDRVKQVRNVRELPHCRILRTVYSGRGTVEDMQPDIDVGTPGVVVLLMPFDSLKFHEHRRERIDGTACKMRAVIIPEIHVSNAWGTERSFSAIAVKICFLIVLRSLSVEY